MRLGQAILFTAVIALCACNPTQRQPQRRTSADNAKPALVPRARVTDGPAPAQRPVPVAKQPVVDPRSSEAAADIARGFVDLINRGRFDEAYMLLGPGAPPRADFDRQFSAYSDLRATLGTPGDQEGAAGSIYLSIPVQLTGRQHGKRVDRSLDLILRRVNDVPGSTEAQRHWHIERIDAHPR